MARILQCAMYLISFLFEPSVLSLKRMFWRFNGAGVVKEGWPMFHKSRVHPISPSYMCNK